MKFTNPHEHGTGEKTRAALRAHHLRQLTTAGLLAAMYVALTLLLPMLSYGVVQCRLSEALTVLAVFTPAAIPGLTVGCLIANLLGQFVGSPVGALDMVLGPLATLLAAVLTWHWRAVRWKGLPVVATLPPVIVNAVVVGFLQTLVAPQFHWQVLLVNMTLIAAGQLVACTLGGLLLAAALERTGAAKVLFGCDTVDTPRTPPTES